MSALADAVRSQVIEILETAHGFALLGSIVPFKHACSELGLIGSHAAEIASAAIDAVRDGDTRKPSREKYADAISTALDRVIERRWQ